MIMIVLAHNEFNNYKSLKKILSAACGELVSHLNDDINSDNQNASNQYMFRNINEITKTEIISLSESKRLNKMLLKSCYKTGIDNLYIVGSRCMPFMPEEYQDYTEDYNLALSNISSILYGVSSEKAIIVHIESSVDVRHAGDINDINEMIIEDLIQYDNKVSELMTVKTDSKGKIENISFSMVESKSVEK